MSTPKLTLEDFLGLDFDVASFGHREHVYAAWLIMSELGDHEGAERYAHTLRSLTVKLGVPEKYHETVTRFYLMLIGERLRQHRDESWQGFEARNTDLFDKALLSRYYSEARLQSTEAHRHFLLPDRVAAAA